MNKGFGVFLMCLCGLAFFAIAIVGCPRIISEGNPVYAGVIGTVCVILGIGTFALIGLISSE